ncbi:MAG TPA: hypothetical protein PLR32_00400 [candidate division Zixibacteria bacterium]|nr:hypothetical protein [candidate division Zixibacteria bacterium]MDD4916706.1 hypothetical protein [candidate division Zixibacteria bacterium]MDM7973548.1 hypothetical protein [candidate division Zixibacteria bacterium]HOD65942.1 hypothetical protein [candidate division Zixibacteria bacterium]HOZ07777.1 hypothetical protein [candidate division Zixibacteria bacterium]
MSALTYVLTLGALIGVVWHVIATMAIYNYLRRRGDKVSFVWLRLMSPIYASRYRAATRQETGRVGHLFYHWVIPINLAFLLVVLAVASRYV